MHEAALHEAVLDAPALHMLARYMRIENNIHPCKRYSQCARELNLRE